MKLIKTFYLSAALIATSYVLPATAEVTAERQFMVFEKTANGITTAAQTITIKFEAGDILNLPSAPDKSTDGFDITSNDCSNGVVATDAGECSITADFTPSESVTGKRSFLYEINAAKVDSTPIFMSNYFDESAEYEASRRIKPVIEKVVISSPTDSDLTKLEESTEYTFDVYVATYEAVRLNAVLLDCDDVGSICGDSVNGTKGTVIANINSDAVTLTESEVTNEGLSKYHFNGFQAIHQKLSFTVFDSEDPDPLKSRPYISSGSFNQQGDNQLVLRVFFRSTRESNRRLYLNVATLFGGNLEIVTNNEASYFDTKGRKLGFLGTSSFGQN
ncbi:hypothetical protein [Thalassomonas sp. M1454]|uniref:hypothetical protein n=1 Tax=Thalassomonas sp. M1454 TaxID=2594477 RepID=UPI00118090DA|nr:hypothetical protein [Thalassomonas sp. M1454]TRX57208.1 hypothetical protein FNN08_06830 [Thalassomonas sp. M1454]